MVGPRMCEFTPTWQTRRVACAEFDDCKIIARLADLRTDRLSVS